MQDFYAASTKEQAERMRHLALKALTHWPGRFDRLELVKYRENAVFSAFRSDGTRVALRIHRHLYHSDAELLSELQWMEALGAAGIDVPMTVATDNGARFVTVAHEAVPEPRQVDMLLWLPGTPVGAIEEGVGDHTGLAALYENAGRLAGRIHNHSALWQRPAGFVRHAWDEDGLLGAEPFWGRFWELPALSPAQATLVEQARQAARTALRQFGKTPENYGLIHADFVPENLLRDGDRLMLIDFDDAGFGWHLFELATALYFHSGTDYYAAVETALIRGYRAVRPLSEADYARLPLFLLLRSFTYLGWVHTRHETETARAATPMFVERSCALAEEFLATDSSVQID
jgi:Ser/Thr protein kinase RdoA (MazF antagonist)